MDQAEQLRAARTDLAADNARAAAKAEHDFELSLLAFIRNEPRVYPAGGLSNLLTLIAHAAANLSKVEGDDYEKAAELIDECAEECDLKYAPDDGHDSMTSREIWFPSRVRSGL